MALILEKELHLLLCIFFSNTVLLVNHLNLAVVMFTEQMLQFSSASHQVRNEHYNTNSLNVNSLFW